MQREVDGSGLKQKFLHFDEMSSVAASKVVILATFSAASDQNFRKMTFPIQCEVSVAV